MLKHDPAFHGFALDNDMSKTKKSVKALAEHIYDRVFAGYEFTTTNPQFVKASETATLVFRHMLIS